MSTPIIIIGTGPKAQAALEIFQANTVFVYGFLAEDESKGTSDIHQVPILGKMHDASLLDLCNNEAQPFIALEDSKQQQDLLKQFEKRENPLPNAIHPQTFLSHHLQLGEGNLILAASMLGMSSRIGAYNFLEEQSIIRSGAQLANYVHVGAGTIIGSDVIIASHVSIGARTIIMPNLKIKAHTIIPPASIITKDV